MARYNYRCENCKKETVISKPMIESSRDEFCTKCEAKLTRVYSIAVKTGDGFKS